VSKVRITLVKSLIGYPADQLKTARALGLRRIGSSVEHDYSRSIRGMLEKVKHVIEYDVREESPAEEENSA
jgi:large subunit ribosomal protein L30